MKALAAEMTNYFSKRLEPLGIAVKELTGDMQLTKGEILRTQVTNTNGCTFGYNNIGHCLVAARLCLLHWTCTWLIPAPTHQWLHLLSDAWGWSYIMMP